MGFPACLRWKMSRDKFLPAFGREGGIWEAEPVARRRLGQSLQVAAIARVRLAGGRATYHVTPAPMARGDQRNSPSSWGIPHAMEIPSPVQVKRSTATLARRGSPSPRFQARRMVLDQ
jgi:hypothetical protein